MGRYVLDHRHAPEECHTAYAAWNGFDSPLRQTGALASCANGGHRLYWTVDADDSQAALLQLPPYLADRTEVSEVREVTIP